MGRNGGSGGGYGGRGRGVTSGKLPPREPAKEAAASDDWWRELPGDDPITLEPLKDLDVPPFELVSGICVGSSAAEGARHYFDAVALASYVTRRGIFENPLTREPLGRDDCVRLDEHIRRHLQHCRDFRVAEALDLQRSIRVRPTAGGAGGRSAIAMRREATAALHGLFNFSSREEAQPRNGGGGWMVVDDDLQRDEEAEAIRENYLRPGGAAPEVTSVAEFPDLSLEATLAGEALVAGAEQGGRDFVYLAEEAAEQARREEQERAEEEAARREAIREAREQAEAARKAAVAAAIHDEAIRREAQVQMEVAAARQREEEKRHLGDEWRSAELQTAALERAAARQREAERAEEAMKKLQDEKDAMLAAEAAAAAAEAEELERAERKKEKEAEKKRKQKEKLKLKKEEERAAKTKQQELEALEAAKKAAPVKCGQCADGILGNKAFEVLGQKFCSTSCVQKFRAANK
eukprot:gnl/TRDRNA2_/TRDRNA2_47946_c0_seq1.p1 gnl/TRDRNA2_/TRDRNA2_47946_c0~~gnl/TRDRNA2_/TRDRNA2_47946_c0_seq1.p1  ORF type:complete len:484 (+),score=147.70 gnl/TRDRNA2_/TRDRNA2_47946_c0_seq1:60-1454(+)